MKGISESRTDAGVPVITDSMPGCRSAGYLVAVRTGSRDEDKSVMGISHLLEHVVFRSTETRSSYQMAKEMEGAGGMLNAFTGKEVTGFFGLTISETADVAREMVSDIVANPLIGHEDTELEKKIVLQELSMVKNDPGTYIFDLFDETIWKGHKLSQGEGGKEKIVEELTSEDLRTYYEDRYGRPNLAVFAVGNVSEEESVRWASEKFDGMEAATAPKRTPPPVPKPKYRFVSNRADHYQVALGFPSCRSPADDLRYPFRMLSSVLGAGTSSRLFQEVREKNALVYSVFSSVAQSTDASYMGIYMSSTAENVENSIDAVAKVLRTFLDEGLEDGELERTKRLLKGEIIRSQESTGRRLTSAAKEYMLSGGLYSLEDTISKIDAVTGEDVMKAAGEIIRPETLNAVILGKSNKKLKEMDICGLEF